MYRCGAEMTAGYVKFNWNRYIDFSDDLFKSMLADEDDELKDRCGISRAYYGAFHRALAYLKKINITIDINNKGSHNLVINQFKDIGRNNRLWSKVGLDLERLKNQRKKADYYDRYFTNEKNINLKSQLKLAILIARSIVERIDKIEEEEFNK